MFLPELRSSRTLPQLLQSRATLHPDRTAAVFIDACTTTTITYQELWTQSVAVARRLQTMDFHEPVRRPTEAPRVLLVQPPGLSFLSAFFGAQLAGWIPVPTSYPKPNRPMPRVDALTHDCNPSAILTTKKTLAGIDKTRLSASTAALPMIAVDSIDSGDENADFCPFGAEFSEESIALLQYTSGSTNDPKGVIISQRNIMANIASIAVGFGIEFDEATSIDCNTSASWLPFFHDMGLMAGVLAPLWAGYRSVLISPQTFIRRPIEWLKLISDFNASVSGAPSFAYDLCADRVAPEQMASLNLRAWRLAFCGAEPIRARTLHTFAQRFSSVGFSESSFYPCYGLAEATLLAAGAAAPSVPKVIHVNRIALREGRVELVTTRSKRDATPFVSCGSAPNDTTIKIVDPQSFFECSDQSIGEVWLRGESITDGYWNRAELNEAVFERLRKPSSRASRRGWISTLRKCEQAVQEADGDFYFRTGDLGFLDSGELYITGRIKDVVIVRGRNYFPQDIEATVLQLGFPIADRAVAFSVEGPRAEGLAIVVEVNRDTEPSAYQTTVRDIRRAIIEEHEIDPRLVLLVRPGIIPVTTSGKLQRAACRAAVISVETECRHRWERSGGTESPPLPIPNLPANITPCDQPAIESQVREWLRIWLISRVGIEPSEVDFDRRFDDYGLDSLAAVELSSELEDWSGVEFTPSTSWQHPTIAAMATFVAEGLVGTESKGPNDETISLDATLTKSHPWTATVR